MHLRSLNSVLLQPRHQYVSFTHQTGPTLPNIHEMPLCYSAPVGVVDALLRYRQHALFGEEELLDWSIVDSMTAVRGVAFECRAVERSDAPLCGCESVQQGCRLVMLTRLLPVHSSSWDVSKAKVATGVAG